MLQKIIRTSLLILLTFNFASAQQECPQFEWVESLKTVRSYRFDSIRTQAVSIGSSKYLHDKEGNHLFALHLGYEPNGPDSFSFEIAGNTISMAKDSNEINNRIMILKLNKDFDLLWHNSLIQTYDSISPYGFKGDLILADMCLDKEGNIYIVGEGRGMQNIFTLKCDNKNMELSYSPSSRDYNYRDGFLLKLNPLHGFAFWLKKLEGISPAQLQINENDNMYLAFTNYKDTIKFDNHLIAHDTDKVGIAQMNTSTDLQWITWGSSEADYVHRVFYNHGIDMFSLDINDNVYSLGLFDSTLTKVNGQGQIEWQRHFPSDGTYNNNQSKLYNALPRHVLVNNVGKVYITMRLFSRLHNFYDFGNNLILSISPMPVINGIIWEMDAATGQTTNAAKLWESTDSADIWSSSLSSDENGNLYISGSMQGKGAVQLGDSVYHIIQRTSMYNAASVDAFLSKIQFQENNQNIKFLWTIRTDGGGEESIILSNTSANGTEHYFYGGGWTEDFKYGDYHFTDTFHIDQSVYNKVRFVFGKINTDCSLNANELEDSLHSISIYPNPANTQLTISNLPLNSIIQLSDLGGRIVYTQNNKSESMIQIPLQGLMAGMYFVSVVNDGKKEFRKVVVNE